MSGVPQNSDSCAPVEQQGVPALPWGHSDAPAAQPDVFEASLRKIMLSAALGMLGGERPAKRARTSTPVEPAAAVASFPTDAAEGIEDEAVPDDLAAGQRIEVKWQLEDGEGAVSKWWGASLLEEKADAAPADAAPADAAAGIDPALGAPAVKGRTWMLRYDAHAGFEQEDKEATLLTKHVLAHGYIDVLAHGDLEEPLAWRREGEAYEPADSDDDEQENEQEEGFPLEALSTAIEEQAGGDIETTVLQRMKAVLPIEQQQIMAAGFNDLMTHITGKLKQVAAAKRAERGAGGDGVIQSDDVRAAFASWREERQAP